MPQAAAGAVYAAIAVEGATVATVAFAVVAAAVTYIAVSAAIAYAFTAITKALAGSPDDLTNEAAARQTVVRSASEPRRLIYGLVRVAGPLVFAATSGVDNALLHLVIPIAGSEITAVDEVWFNDIQLPTAGVGPITSGKYAGVAVVYAHLGQAGQTVDTILQTAVGTTLWDNTHILSDTAYLYVQLTWNQTAYPQGIPKIAAVVRGRKIYDPRTTLTAYSVNSALVVRDYLTHPNGLRCAIGDIDDATFTTAANICDEVITLNPSGTQVRYDANGSIPLDMPHKTAVDQLLTSCAGYLVYTQGVYRMYAGAYRTPTVTLTEDNMSGPISISPRISRSELFNSVRGQFVNPNANWQAVDFPPITNATYVTEDGAEKIFVDLPLPFTTNPARAQRIAKIMLEKSRQSISVVFQGNLTCFRVQPLDTVMLTIAKLGWSAKVFLCVGWAFTETGQIVLTLQEEAAGVYTWAGGSETLIDLAPNTTLPNPLDVAVPTSFVVSSTNEFLVGGNGQVTTRLKLVWVPPADTYVKVSGRIEIQYKENAAASWLAAPAEAGAALGAWLAPVQPGTSYDVRIRAVNSLEIASAWVTATAHVAAAPSFSDNSDNLIPNPNSEVGTPALGVTPDGTGLVNDAVNAFAGQWVRRFTATTSVQTALLSSKFAAAVGDQYYFEAYLKCTTAYVGAVNLTLQYFDAAGTLSTTSTTAHIPTTTYVRIGVTGAVPTGSTAIRAAIAYGSASDGTKNLYVDNMYMRRLVDGNIIMDGSISDAQLTNGYNNDNMIPNANSELGTTALTLVPEGNGLVNDAVNAFQGAWCRRVVMAASLNGTVTLTNFIPVNPGETFLFEGYLKASALLATNPAYLVVNLFDSTKATFTQEYSAQVLVSTTYRKFSCPFTIPPGKVYIRAYFEAGNAANLNTGKILYGDSFLLKRVSTGLQNGNAYSDNLVVNGSFERGNQDYQTTSTAVKEAWTFLAAPGDAPEGNFCLRLNAPNASFGAGGGYGAILRAFPITPGDTYSVRCKIRHSNGNGTNYVEMIESTSQPQTGFVGNLANSYLDGYSTFVDFHAGVSNAAYTTWKQLDFVYTPVSTARWASLAFYNHGSSTGTLDIDEVEVRRQISTQHVEDNAITQPVSIYTAASANVKFPFGGLGYTEAIVQEGAIVTTGGQVQVTSNASYTLQGAGGISQIDAGIRRAFSPIGVVSLTATAVNGSTHNYTVVTSAPHGLTTSDGIHFFGTTSAEINSTSSILRIYVLSTILSPTSFTMWPSGSYAGTPPAVGAVFTGGTLATYVNIVSTGFSPFTLLRVPASTTYTISATAIGVDSPPAGTWTYYATATTLNSDTAPTAASAAQRSISLLGLKK